MKKRILIILILGFVLLSKNVFATEVRLTTKINDKVLKTDGYHLLVQDNVFISAKEILLAFNQNIEWNAENRQVNMNINNNTIIYDLETKKTLLEGEELKLEPKIFISNGKTYLPINFVKNYFECESSFDKKNYIIQLTTENSNLNQEYLTDPKYTAEDLNLLAKIVQVESSDSSMPMKLGIANVVLNRVKDSRFPNTISEVIYQVDVHVQFPPAHRESFKKVNPSTNSIIAAKNALEGKNNISNCLFFNNRPFNSKKDDLYKVIDGEYFYK